MGQLEKIYNQIEAFIIIFLSQHASHKRMNDTLKGVKEVLQE